jgi:hypothetical protein
LIATRRASAGREAKAPFLSLLALVIGSLFPELVLLVDADPERHQECADWIRYRPMRPASSE